ncbi:MAG: hypothetical protein V7K89_19395, partial [Nostoc sp.]
MTKKLIGEREIILCIDETGDKKKGGQRRRLRYYQISKSNVPDPTGDESWYVMTNLSVELQLNVAQLYSLRNWIEYGFKQVKNEL